VPVDYGIVAITATSEAFENDAFGTSTTTFFYSILEQLQSKYGRSHVSDSLLEGSIWNEPREWMASLKRKERTLATLWSLRTPVPMPFDLASVYLGCSADDDDRQRSRCDTSSYRLKRGRRT